jgi:hypothetical protein
MNNRITIFVCYKHSAKLTVIHISCFHGKNPMQHILVKCYFKLPVPVLFLDKKGEDHAMHCLIDNR